MLLLTVMREVNNYFLDIESVEYGSYTIEDNRVALKGDFVVGQYIAIVDSALFDYIYKIIDISPDGYLLESNEPLNGKFEGVIYGLKIPVGFMNLVTEIQANIDKTPQAQSGYSSEHFGDYSYTLATDEHGMPASWQSIFRSQLNRWRKPFGKIRL